MSFYLNTKSGSAIGDFILSVVDFLPASAQRPYREAVEEIRAHRYPPKEKLLPLVKTLGRSTWPARRALAVFLAGEGAEMEWKELEERTRAKTATALRKLKKASQAPDGDATGVDEAFRHADAVIYLDGDMDVELSMLRPQVRMHLWQKHKQMMKEYATKAEAELQRIEERLNELHHEAERSRTERELLLAKLATFEDRVYFGGESLPTEMLDAEIQYDREERELPTVE